MALTEEQKNRLDLAFELGAVPQADRGIWLARFEQSPEDITNTVVALFQLYPEEIRWFGEVQSKKEDALARLDKEAWKKMVEEEKEHLEKLASAYT